MPNMPILSSTWAFHQQCSLVLSPRKPRKQKATISLSENRKKKRKWMVNITIFPTKMTVRRYATFSDTQILQPRREVAKWFHSGITKGFVESLISLLKTICLYIHLDTWSCFTSGILTDLPTKTRFPDALCSSISTMGNQKSHEQCSKSLYHSMKYWLVDRDSPFLDDQSPQYIGVVESPNYNHQPTIIYQFVSTYIPI